MFQVVLGRVSLQRSIRSLQSRDEMCSSFDLSCVADTDMSCSSLIYPICLWSKCSSPSSIVGVRSIVFLVDTFPLLWIWVLEPRAPEFVFVSLLVFCVIMFRTIRRFQVVQYYVQYRSHQAICHMLLVCLMLQVWLNHMFQSIHIDSLSLAIWKFNWFWFLHARALIRECVCHVPWHWYWWSVMWCEESSSIWFPSVMACIRFPGAFVWLIGWVCPGWNMW